ncbi:MAG TPA: hypothetical protein PLQ54_07980 [Armatimonadota bacterium]|nr:hypothetical protein [Armatimonadota bacterium]
MRRATVWVIAVGALSFPAWPQSPEVLAEVEAVIGPWRVAAPADNGFADLVAAIQRVTEGDSVDLLNGPDAGPAAEELIATNAEALAAVRAAMGRECRVPPVTSFTTPLPYLANARVTARVLCVEGRCREVDGDPSGALGSYLDAVQLGGAISRGGTLIHGLVDAAVIRIASAEVRRLCESGPAFPDATLADAIDRLTRLERAGPSPQQFLATELEASVAGLREIAENPQLLEQIATDAGMSRSRGTIELDAEARALIEYYGRLIELLDLPYRDSLGVAQPPEAAETPLAAMVAPSADRASERLRGGAAVLRGVRVLLAIVRFRQAREAYPDTLSQLVPDYLPAAVVDPYTLEPFVYAGTPNGRALYSPGPDGVDDGADEERDVVIAALPE